MNTDPFADNDAQHVTTQALPEPTTARREAIFLLWHKLNRKPTKAELAAEMNREKA
jgi:hypothetical protein